MKNLLQLLFLGFCIVSHISCEGIRFSNKHVQIEFIPEGNFIITDTTVVAGSKITTQVRAKKGIFALKKFTVFQISPEDSMFVPIDSNFIEINNSSDKNPKLLSGNEISGFTFEISFPVSSTNDSVTYKFEVESEVGEIADVSFEIITEVSVETLLANKLFNKDGLSGTGGIDLHTGNSTNLTDTTAELVDEGSSEGIWKGQFSAKNILETTIMQSSESFDNILIQTNLINAFINGNSIGTIISPSIGNVYIVKSGDFFFAIKITDIVATTDNNNDYILMDIKR